MHILTDYRLILTKAQKIDPTSRQRGRPTDTREQLWKGKKSVHKSQNGLDTKTYLTGLRSVVM
jgi:hypothetical protein